MGYLVLVVGAIIALICAWLVLSMIGMMTGERPGGLFSDWWGIFSKLGSRPSSYAEPLPELLRPPRFRVGDTIRVLQVPLEVERDMPAARRDLFQRCVGRVLRVEGTDEFGGLEVHVKDDGTQADEQPYHVLFVDPQYAQMDGKVVLGREPPRA